MIGRESRVSNKDTTVNTNVVIIHNNNHTTLPPHHLFVPEKMKYLHVTVDIPTDPWEDETVLKVFPNIPRGSDQCYERFLYLKKIDYEAYVASKNEGKCPPRPMSLCYDQNSECHKTTKCFNHAYPTQIK